MATYRVYTDTDPAAVLTNTTVSATASQASSGATQTAEVTGLTNGTRYYIAMEAVDAAGNISSARTNTFKDGTVAFGTPERTVGPAELLGENGCSLVLAEGSWYKSLLLIILGGFLIVIKKKRRAPEKTCLSGKCTQLL
jgi:hypothetical protein